jgi:hypothetical protein
LVEKAVCAMHANTDVLALPFDCLQRSLALAEPQSFCLYVLGHLLDKSSLRPPLSHRPLLW